MLKDVEEYVATVDAAKTLHKHQTETAQEAYEDASRRSRTERVNLDEAYRRFNTVTSAANELKSASIRLAWAKLGFSEDPLVAYIATRIPQNRREEYADFVLRALPATHQQLRDLADRKSWCDEFEGFLRQAILDGILDDGRSVEMRNLEAYLVRQVNRRYVDEIMRLVAAATVAEVKLALEAQKETAESTDAVPEHLTALVEEEPSRNANGDLLVEAAAESDGESAPATEPEPGIQSDTCDCASCQRYRAANISFAPATA